MIRALAWCDRNGGWILLVLLALSAAILIASCGSRPAAPATAITGSALPPAGSATANKEAFYRGEVERLAMGLEQAKAGLRVARNDAAEAELKTWQTWTRWIGLAGVALAVLLGGALSWLISPRVGIPAALILAGTALAVLGFGAALRWLPAVLALGLALGLAAWALYHHRARQALAATARMGDAIEAGASLGFAKLSAQAAQELAGLHRYVQRARGKA